VVCTELSAHLGEEVQCCIHASHVDKQADHGHGDGRVKVLLELLLEDLAALAALGHCIDVDFGKRVALFIVRVACKDAMLILEDHVEEVVLDVFAP